MATPANRGPLLELVMPRLNLWVEQEVGGGISVAPSGRGDRGRADGVGHEVDPGEAA